MSVGGTVLTTKAVKASPTTLVFLCSGMVAILGMAFSGSYLVRMGTVRPGVLPWRWRRKYPWRFYSPWGGGQHGRYFAGTAISFSTAMVFWYGEVQLIHRHLPVSISEFLGWVAECWLAIAMARTLLSGFSWGKLAVPAIGLFQVAGALVAAGVLFGSGVNAGMFVDPIVLSLLAASFVVAWTRTFTKKTRLQEEAYFASHLDPFTPEDHLFLSAKLTFWPTPMRLLWCFVGFLVSGFLTGFPHVENWGLLLGGIGIYALMAVGKRVSGIANAEGDPALNGIGATGGLGFTFLWVWLFQGIVPHVFQIVGAVMTMAGAVALAFTHDNVRAWAAALLRRHFRKEGGKHA